MRVRQELKAANNAVVLNELDREYMLSFSREEQFQPFTPFTSFIISNLSLH